jgi:ABC-type multidrug transport system ATPase subunit
MHILTGLTPPTSGNAYLNGFAVNTEVSACLCKQQVIWDWVQPFHNSLKFLFCCSCYNSHFWTDNNVIRPDIEILKRAH